ncbi:MAG: hypothetical protein SOY73_03680 [Blautia sp.]|nr:hypothetical protein [Blautia sp.]MDY3998199.1 hypothetical protein [Blautia sp.]
MKNVMRYKRYIITGAAVLIVFLLLIFGLRSCGVSHKSPEGVVRSLIKAYSNGNQSKIKDCYGVKKETEESLQKEIDATIKYFKAHNPKNVEIRECDVLSENDQYTYVYVTYDMKLENDQSYPCVSTYMTDKENGRYYILSSSKVTDDMRKQAAADYAKFMTTNTYKNYVKEYETFTKKNPGYEDKIAGKLS